MYSALQRSLGPLSTPMFLTVCYSLSKAPRRPGTPRWLSLWTPSHFHAQIHTHKFVLAVDHNAACEGNFLFLLPESVSINKIRRQKGRKKKKKDKHRPHSRSVSWLLASKDLWDPGSNILINCYLTPFYTPLTHVLILAVICIHLSCEK